MISGLIARFGLKMVGSVGGALFVSILIPILLQVHSCKKEAKNQATIEHNNKKRDEFVEQKKEGVRVYQEREKFKTLEPAKIKIYSQIYADKNCITQKLALCKDTKSDECKDKVAMACKKVLPELSDEEVNNKRKEHFRDLKGLIN